MYTSHPTQPTSPGGRPEYCMNQLGAYAMTHNRETFRQGATAFRNARDYAKAQRDEVIKRANKRVNDSQVGTLAADATDASLDETTIEALSQESRTSLNEGSNITADPPESETSADELALDYRLPAKRLRRHSKRPY
jgi:hypothetical protein